MARTTNWESQIGTRLRLRDLHVLFSVIERGSMSKAAMALGISQPAVSEVITDLEHAIGFKLLDRSSQGVVPTIYGRAFARRAFAAFDELKQGLRDVEHLADPSGGEVRIGCLEVVSSILPPFIQHFSQRHSRAVVQVEVITPSPAPEGAQLMLGPALVDLLERKLDLVIGIVPKPVIRDAFDGDANVETLFDDTFVVVAGKRSRWARRRKLGFEELAEAQWILANMNTWNYIGLTDAFRARGLQMPNIAVVTFSLPLRLDFVINNEFLTVFAKSVAARYPVRPLALDLPLRSLAVVLITPRNRMLSPVAESFIASARETAKSMRDR